MREKARGAPPQIACRDRRAARSYHIHVLGKKPRGF
jgi:hypothetical protein